MVGGHKGPGPPSCEEQVLQLHQCGRAGGVKQRRCLVAAGFPARPCLGPPGATEGAPPTLFAVPLNVRWGADHQGGCELDVGHQLDHHPALPVARGILQSPQ
jgi:hypothetical protein